MSSFIKPKFLLQKRYKSISYPVSPFKTHKFDLNLLKKTIEIDDNKAIEYFKTMSTIRAMEQELSRLYKEKLIRGFCHLYSGQEACCVGMEASLIPGDGVITAYRSHGWTYTRGQTIHSIIAELLGKKTGCSKGHGGSMHTYGNEFYGGNGIVGAQVPLGAGIALRNQYLSNNNICVSLYGDGAANQGQIFETFNMAALWKLPVIFVCENNLYAMGTSIERGSYSTEFYKRGDYIPGIQVDGNSLTSVIEATRVASEYCRSGNGPIILELVTYRYFGHSMSDPGTSYRSTEEVQTYRKEHDPIKIFRKLIIDYNIISDQKLDEINEKIIESIELDVEKANSDPFPNVSDVANHIFIDGNNNQQVRGCDQHTWYNSV